MKFAESWLREWVEPQENAQELAERLTMAGHEVDTVSAEGEGLDGIVIVKVLEVERHPNADKLSVCRASDGTRDDFVIVCGAPNVVSGMKAALALPGSKLPNGVKLRRSKIRGIESEGMLCSPVEIGLGTEADGILKLPDDAPTGEMLARFLELPDRIFEIDLTPNRGDCFSVLGLARDIAALTDVTLKERKKPEIPPSIEDVHPVELEDAAACPRFTGRIVRGIDPSAASPVWLTERLRRSGIRAISPVVDVTNYVMLELGQPLHAYDSDRLSGAIRPRFARAGEHLTLLDEREIELAADTVVVSDESGPIGLAGIMGGLKTAVTISTCNVFLEAAFWPRDIMAGRARHYGLHTDASLRFERGVDPTGQVAAIERATELLLAIAGGAAGPLTDAIHDFALPKRSRIFLSREGLDRILGSSLDNSDVTRILRSLHLAVEESDDGWHVQPPAFRFDLEIADDLIEEVARIFGYDRIPEETATAALPLRPVTERQVGLEGVSDTLVARDYQEVVTWSFIDAESNRRFTGAESALVLSNPISSELSVMRGSLWPGLLRIAAANLARQQDRVRLFEAGATFHGSLENPLEVSRLGGLVLGAASPEHWDTPEREVDFFDVKGDLETLFATTGAEECFSFLAGEHPVLQPGQCARIIRGDREVGLAGKLHPTVGGLFDISRAVLLFELDVLAAFEAEVPSAKAISKFPGIRRDIAVVVAEEVTAAELVRVALSAAPEMIRQVIVFDVYRGSGIEPGLKSVALGLILQETSRTLTDEDADSAMAAALQKLQQEVAAILRE